MSTSTTKHLSVNGQLKATYTRGTWHRLVQGELVPLDPSVPADAKLLATCQTAREVIPQPPEADPIQDRIAWIDREFPRRPRRPQ